MLHYLIVGVLYLPVQKRAHLFYSIFSNTNKTDTLSFFVQALSQIITQKFLSPLFSGIIIKTIISHISPVISSSEFQVLLQASQYILKQENLIEQDIDAIVELMVQLGKIVPKFPSKEETELLDILLGAYHHKGVGDIKNRLQPQLEKISNECISQFISKNILGQIEQKVWDIYAIYESIITQTQSASRDLIEVSLSLLSEYKNKKINQEYLLQLLLSFIGEKYSYSTRSY